MLWKRGQLNARRRIAVDVAETARRVVYEATRDKPKDASPLAKHPIFRVAARIFAAIWRFLGFHRPRKSYTMVPYVAPKRREVSKGKRGRLHKADATTPPRGFGSSRSDAKLSKGIKLYPKREDQHV
jgi:hypothetical protein